MMRSDVSMGDYVLLFWAGFFLGFWTCALLWVWYGVGRARWRQWRWRRKVKREGEAWRARLSKSRWN
jgi:hypothetical protein